MQEKIFKFFNIFLAEGEECIFLFLFLKRIRMLGSKNLKKWEIVLKECF